jgi:hypothetical protein
VTLDLICWIAVFVFVFAGIFMAHSEHVEKRRARRRARRYQQSSHVRVVQGENVVAIRRKAS